jgi:murein L,D-transpeptidase YcbB/YkuD
MVSYQKRDMKKIISAVAIASLTLAACDNMGGFFKNESTHNAADSASSNINSIVTRDMSITPRNAYSDLFLDSTIMEQYIQRQKINDTLARDLRNFYNTRNYQYAWFTTQGVTEQGRNFWNLYDSNIDNTQYKADSVLDKRLDTLLIEDTLQIGANDTSFIQTELAITKEFIHYAKANGNADWRYMIPTKKINALELADSLSNKIDTAQLANNRPYMLMRGELKRYHEIAKTGGWQPINLGAKSIKKGASLPAIASLKKRLRLSGDYTANDTTTQFTDSLEVAIKSLQERYGFRPTGVITDTLVNALNVPIEQRIQQLLINMNRMAWMPVNQRNEVIEVNVPAYMLHVYENNAKAFDMEVVVGKQGTNTMMFTGTLDQVVFNPSWNIPQSIVESEILPAMQKDPNYLKKNNMEIVSNGTIPQIRQLPGQKNPLGKVKFLFPNSYEIYLHDSPAKDLFAIDKRAFSHGCIRLADAFKMAQYLLKDQSNWTPEKIQQAMNGNKEQIVKLQKPVPVIINYYTAWVDDNGRVNFRDDIYKHDMFTASRMFTNDNNTSTLSPSSDTTQKAG